jgi:arylsulfatase A-like enzyme
LGPIPTDLSPLRKWKGHAYEGGIRIPAIFYWKGKLMKGKEVEAYFSNTDYFATIKDILGDEGIQEDGQSILPLLRGGEIQERAIFWHYPHFSNQMGRPSSAIRKGDWKLVFFYESGGKELYRITEDDSETQNLASVHLEKAEELWGELKDWLLETKAPMPIIKASGRDFDLNSVSF